MRIAFGIVSLFPGGGLQRDCVEIAKIVRNQDHEVVTYTCRLRDYEATDDNPVMLLQNNATTNHRRQYKFAIDFLRETSDHFDLVVGFDKLLNLDVLYCADASMAYRMRQQKYLLLSQRYRGFRKLEESSFSPNRPTQIILLSPKQVIQYESAWNTELDRMTVIPGTMSLNRRHPEYRHNGIRQKLRSLLGFSPGDWVWLSIGVQPKTKGIDRTIDALSRFPNAQLLIAGLNQTDRASEKLLLRARKYHVAARVKWLGHHEDICSIMAASDLLIHPARYDTTGTIILEAIANGLPVITTASCGYAHHVEVADAGVVINEPFDFSLFVAALRRAQNPKILSTWSAAAEKYGEEPALYRGRALAAEIIINVGKTLHKSKDKNSMGKLLRLTHSAI